jgi:hypothetical protein
LQQELGRLVQKYGEEFDPHEVVAAALQVGSSDLEAVFKQVQFDRVYAEREAIKAETAKRAQSTQKKRAASVVSGGASPAPRASEDSVAILTPADAIRAAMASLSS